MPAAAARLLEQQQAASGAVYPGKPGEEKGERGSQDGSERWLGGGAGEVDGGGGACRRWFSSSAQGRKGVPEVEAGSGARR